MIVDTEIVAVDAIKHWYHDIGTLKFWRGSSNIIYFFKRKNEGYFLRLSHEEENTIENISAELDFLSYLGENNYPCNQSVISEFGKYIEEVKSDYGEYFAVVFKQVKGEHLDIDIVNDDIFIKWMHLLLNYMSFLVYIVQTIIQGIVGEIKLILLMIFYQIFQKKNQLKQS